MSAAAPPLRRKTQLLRDLRAAMLADFEPELQLAEKFAVLFAGGHTRSDIARLLDVTPAALKVAEARVKSAAGRLEAGDD
jgi:hypothetical protein